MVAFCIQTNECILNYPTTWKGKDIGVNESKGLNDLKTT